MGRGEFDGRGGVLDGVDLGNFHAGFARLGGELPVAVLRGVVKVLIAVRGSARRNARESGSVKESGRENVNANVSAQEVMDETALTKWDLPCGTPWRRR